MSVSTPPIDSNNTLQNISLEEELRTDQVVDTNTGKVKHIARTHIGDLRASTEYLHPSESPLIPRSETPVSFSGRVVSIPNEEERRRVRFDCTRESRESRESGESGGLSSVLEDSSIRDSFDGRYSAVSEFEEGEEEPLANFDEGPEAEDAAQYLEHEPWKRFPKKPQVGSPLSHKRSKSQQIDCQTHEPACATPKTPDGKPSSKIKRRPGSAGAASTANEEPVGLSVFLKSNIAVYQSKKPNPQQVDRKSPKLAEVGYYLRRETETLPGIIIDHHQGKHAKFPGVFDYQGGRGDGVFNQGMRLTDLENMFKLIITHQIFPFLDAIPAIGKEIPPMIETDVSHLKGIFSNYEHITICAAYNRNFNCWEIHIYPT